MNVIKVNVKGEKFYFWRAVKIYCQRPNSINKQILFSKDVLIVELQSFLTFTDCYKLFDKFCFKLSNEYFVSDSIMNVEFSDFNMLGIINVEDVFESLNKMCLLVRRLVPKVNDSYKFFEFIFLDLFSTKVYIFTKSLSNAQTGRHKSIEKKKQDPLAILKFSFIQLMHNDQCLEISYDETLSEKGITWLHATFAPKFLKLMSDFDMFKLSKNLCKLPIDSKVDIVQYYKLYEEMKCKYAKYFLDKILQKKSAVYRNWTESTDPKKYIYEDIGIATYLMMLWNKGNIPGNKSKKQKFVDLGCGNGLLVHILNSQGHLGIGVDIRKRKIWDVYPATTVLQEKAVIPTKKTIFPDADWLIGNHSDELTAWIPIMARLSNNHCQYFVLPCCPFQLNGMKFQRKNCGFSSYQDFISYVYKISQLCDFETWVDKLRIPSTKRTCLIGLNKTAIAKDKYTLIKDSVIKFINQECQSSNIVKENSNNEIGHVESKESQISLNFKLRNSVQPIRNCTKLPKGFIDKALITIMHELLKEKVLCTVIKNGRPCIWNKGKKLAIGELASSLSENLLKQLKSECKGLQTLLKNHHFLFEVNKGHVEFRNPESMLEICNKFSKSHNEKWKSKNCWFFDNHPDKCPLSDDFCSYSHNINKEITEL